MDQTRIRAIRAIDAINSRLAPELKRLYLSMAVQADKWRVFGSLTAANGDQVTVKTGPGEGSYRYAVALDGNDDVVYFVKHRAKRLAFTGCQQVLAFRVYSDAATPGLAQLLMIKVLLPHYKTLISDDLHTDAGQTAWVRTIQEVFRTGIARVYLYDDREEKRPPKLYRIRNMHDYTAVRPIAYGDTDDHMETLLVISTKRLITSPDLPDL